MKKNILILLHLFFINCVCCLKAYSTDKPIIDAIYNEDVRTVLLYPASISVSNSPLPPPIVAIGDMFPLLLEFDKFGSEVERFAVKIINCNHDWTVSQLNPVEYLNDYNEFYIRDREFSMNTKIRFTHYRFTVPSIKLSGNYVLKVYEENNQENIIFTRRFMVHESGAVISSSLATVVGVEQAFRNQQIDFSVGYNEYAVYNPQDQIKVMIRQNFRWDSAITGLKPTFINDFDKRLDYKHFNFENNFKGGNEFRMFDIRNLMSRNLNVEYMNTAAVVNQAILYTDKSREGWAYSKIMDDMNGRFFIQNVLMQHSSTDADYVNITFSLKSANEEAGSVYVTGGFSEWQLSDTYKMTYFPERQLYEKTILLKQGFYNYLYSLVNSEGKRDDVHFEGTHSRTENNYEILVYFRPLGFRTDLLIGYKLF
jgi:hypothetical protein